MAIQGSEKAWAALLSGGSVTAATTLALWLMSLTGSIEPPDAATISAAVTGMVASLFAAAGAYLATNTAPAHPDDATPPVVAVPPTPVPSEE